MQVNGKVKARIKVPAAIENADAIAAAKTGDTVKLVKDITSSSTIQISQKTDIKLDLNGKKLTVTSGDALLNNGALTILDSLSGGKIISEKSGTIGVGSNSTTTIQSGEFESVEGAVFTGLSTGATITIEGGTFSASDNVRSIKTSPIVKMSMSPSPYHSS